jgi:methionine biosynthesis protein MetW
MRLDHKVIFDIIEPRARVLDLGCGDGELLSLLEHGKQVKGQGVELNDKEIYKCMEKGLTVFHGDIDSGLIGYPDKSFDYVILNQTMQEAKKAELVIQESLRVGKKVIVGFPNFAPLMARVSVAFFGRTPITKSLPYRWYNTPNLHFLTIKDFRDFCREKNITIEKAVYLGSKGVMNILPNLFALNAIFVIKK